MDTICCFFYISNPVQSSNLRAKLQFGMVALYLFNALLLLSNSKIYFSIIFLFFLQLPDFVNASYTLFNSSVLYHLANSIFILLSVCKLSVSTPLNTLTSPPSRSNNATLSALSFLFVLHAISQAAISPFRFSWLLFLWCKNWVHSVECALTLASLQTFCE